MKALKESALELAHALNALDHACERNDVAEIKTAAASVHRIARAGLFLHRDQLGFSDDDVREIDQVGEIQMGGTPKGPPPEDP